MVQGVGGTGSSGSIKDTAAYKTLYDMYLKSGVKNLDFQAWLQMCGYRDTFLQQIENYIETGNEQYGDDNEDTLNLNKHLSNATGALYQSDDEETFYDFDWESGSYTTLNKKEDVAKAMGLPEGNDIDTINLGYMSAQITNYTFGNLDDGQDGTKQILYGNYANVSYVQQEFDVHYILNALLIDPSDPQYQIAAKIFDDLCENVNQWLPVSEQEELDKIAAEYGNSSAEYKAKLQEVILANLDQANEWVEEHNHVQNTNAGTLGPATDLNAGSNAGTNGVDGTVGGDSSATEEEQGVPEYNLDSVLSNCGLTAMYNGNEKWYGPKHYDNDTCAESSVKEARQYVDEQLTAVMNAMMAEMGDSCTKEIQDYLLKAKAAVVGSIADGEIDSFEAMVYQSSSTKGASNIKNVLGYDTFGSGMYEDYGARAEVSVKNMVDEFIREFETLCENKGKTAEEVEAENKAAEEKAAKEKNDYKTLYNYNMSSIAKDAGVKDVQVINVSTAAEIKQKAMNEVVQPLINKLKSKMSGKSISDADLEKIMNYAAESALANTNEWATTNNNVVYNIDADIIVSKFESALKDAIKSKGYDF